MKQKGRIGILTGGGDVPGLNPAIRAITIRALHEGFEVVGIRRGWAGIIDLVRDKEADNSNNFEILTRECVNKAANSGGTFLHTSRTNPGKVQIDEVPEHLTKKYNKETNDLTEEVLKNLEYLNIEYLIPIGGDDTLSYAVKLFEKGVKIIGIPKTMDNDVPGTDYCIGYSTCVTRTINMLNQMRSSAGSHERFMVVEVFGRYTGYTAMLPTMAGAANRCVIPEYQFDMEKLTQLLIEDWYDNPSRYSVLLTSEGATYKGRKSKVVESPEKDSYGNPKLGGIGDEISMFVKKMAPKYNHGKRINIINQKLGYLVRGGDPDTIDSVVPMAFGNLALELILKGIHGRLIVMKSGRYDNAPLEVIESQKKHVNIKKYYNTERLRPKYKSFEFQPLLILNDEN
jgi:6-phosphofructokinase 1